MIVTNPLPSKDIANPINGLPSVNILYLNDVMRVDKSLGETRLGTMVSDAMDFINGEMEDDIDYIIAQLALNPATRLSGKILRAYKRAVLHEACAMICDQYVDFDTTATTRTRQDKQVEIVDKSQRMRRIVQHAIADMTNRPRNRVKLI